VGAVKRGSDAWTRGLRPGDKVLSMDGQPMNRDRIWLANYRNYILEPGQKMTLVIQKPDQTQQQLVIKANESRRIGIRCLPFRWKYVSRESASRAQFYELSDEVMVWRMPQLYAR
jgi:C-terminal processing protease CtpA/Prc